jgi:formylmethanofuran dehydrogenase subunit E
MHGINDPNSPENRKKLITWVEIDRCATDGIQSVTGCSLGRRTLKVMNYGIMAATFLNVESQKAFRISVHPDSRKKAKALFPELTDSNHVYMEAYKQMPDNDLFVVEEVWVEVPELEMPGPPPKRTACTLCGEEILKGWEIIKEDKILCRRCADMPLYYTPLQ